VVADALPTVLVDGDPLLLDVHVVSDLRKTILDAEVRARLVWPGGQQEWRWSGDIPADDCVRVGTVRARVPQGAQAIDLDLELRAGDIVVTNRYRSTKRKLP
jgi:hypothetical protein